ncbi:MAG TPA: hypothetical protein VJ729_05910 [Nitrososphaeraceae archaeon]|nr:hypothetical protein [Nitrososphaeraceae archaeon]
MNLTSSFALITTTAVSMFVIKGGVFFVSKPAHACSSCKSINNQLSCTISPDQVCTFYGPTLLVCGTQNSQIMSSG